MIRRITSILNESVTAIPVGERVPFAEVIDGVPTVHAGNGQFVPVINDSAGGVSYWRANGAQQVQQMDRLSACGDAVRISVPIALVAFVRREQCDAPDALLNSAAHQINASLRSIRDSIQGAFAVNVSSMTLGIDLARTNEIKDFIVPSSLAVLTLAAVIHIDASPVCLEKCGEPYDIVCTLIDRASNAKVVECLGPERVAEICDAPPPVCDPLGFDLHNSEDTILVSGMLPDPCGNTLELDAPDATVQLKDSVGDPIGSPVDFPSGTTRDMTAPNGTVKTTDGVTTVQAIKSNANGNLPQSVIKYKDSANASQVTAASDTEFASGSLRPATEVPRAQQRDSDGVVTGTYVDLDDLINDTIPNCPVPETDWKGEFPALNENTPTYNNEGDNSTGWTTTAGTASIASSVFRLTQTTLGVNAESVHTVTQPVAGKDWTLYMKIRSSGVGQPQIIQVRGTGTQSMNIGLNFDYTTPSSVAGTMSIRSVNLVGTTANAIIQTGLSLATEWQELSILFDSKNAAFVVYKKQTDGTWKFMAHVNGESFATNIRLIAAANSGSNAWIEFDHLTMVAPNIQSIGDSLTKGATLFSPIVADGLTDGDSMWQRWAKLYPSLRNNLIVNKGVGGNTTAQVAARIQADVLDNDPAIVLLSACNNDIAGPITLADRTTNTQSSINLCAAASVPVVLYNATYCTINKAGQPAQKDYYEEWWDDYMPALTGLAGTIDIMGGLSGADGYADLQFTQSDHTHPNAIGYRRKGEWIAALPYA